MSNGFVKIVAFGLIGEDNHKGPYRQAVFKDTESGSSGEILIFEKERPSIWIDIVKMENGGNLPPYRGYVIRYNTLDLVVLGDESLDEAFAHQKWKLHIKGKISYSEAEKMRNESLGYKTNLTFGYAIEIAWRPIDTNSKLIKFRVKDNNTNFKWTNWYEIINK